MKKILLFACLLMLGSSVFAQNGALTVNNTSSTCNITVTMYAKAPTLQGTGACDEIISNTFVVPAGMSRSWTSNVSFGSAVGWASTPGPIGASTTDFQWTSAEYTSSCSPSCSPSATWQTIADQYACRNANLLFNNGCVQFYWNSPFAGSALADVTLLAY